MEENTVTEKKKKKEKKKKTFFFFFSNFSKCEQVNKTFKTLYNEQRLARNLFRRCKYSKHKYF